MRDFFFVKLIGSPRQFEEALAFLTVVNPVITASELIDTELSGLKLSSREARKNHRDVATAWVHRVGAVAATLVVAARMDMNVSDEAHAQFSAFGMHNVQEAPVERNDAGVEAVRVDIIVKKKFADDADVVLDVAEQERTALACSIRTSPQFHNTTAPHVLAALNLGRAATKPVNGRRE
jgi:hypothetical protein